MIADQFIEKWELSEKNAVVYQKMCGMARDALLLKGEHRFLVAGIAIEMHERILGENEPMNTPLAKHLRGMFARDIGFSLAVIDVWISVKNNVVDHLPKEKIAQHSYTELQETAALIKRSDDISLSEALEIVTENESENKKRRRLLLRYSAELVTSCRKYRGNSNEDTNETIHRLKECLKILQALE